MLLNEVLHGVLHEEELDSDALVDEVQLDALLDHDLLSSLLYTQCSELIAVLAIQAFGTFWTTIGQIVGDVVLVH